MQAATFGLGQMIAGRVVGGFGVGLISCTIPLLISEVAKPNKRGILIAALLTLALVSVLLGACTDGILTMQTGIVIARWMIFGLLKHTTNQEFIRRFPVAFQGSFGIFTAVRSQTVPGIVVLY